MLWVKINGNSCVFNKDIYVGCVYIPHQNSEYANANDIDMLLEDMIDLNVNDNLFLLCGDFNAHTNILNDILSLDEHIYDSVGLDNEIFNSFDAINNMKLLGIPTERSNSDPHRVDNYGYRLINLCKQASVCIFNGRAGVDKSVGKSTTKFNTVIDYFIGSPELLCKTSSLEVEDFDQELSDVHCGLNCKINIYECKSVDRNTINKNVNNTLNSKVLKRV